MSKGSYLLAGLASISQFIQMKLAIPPIKKGNGTDSFRDSLAKSMNVQTKYIMPIIVFYIGLKLSAAVALYWTTMNIFAIVHETIVRKKAGKIWKTNTQEQLK
jgi:membrane protein insertase Oxa1/YidC/SpoIIIJ